MPEAETIPGYGITLEALQSLDSMEGVYAHPVVEIRKKSDPKPPAPAWPGYLLAVGIAAASYAVHYFPFAPFRVESGSGVRYPVSASIVAILLGIALRNLIRLPVFVLESAKGMPRRVIPPSIVLTGASLNLAAVGTAGVRALAITMLCILTGVAASIRIGSALKLRSKTSMLLGAGTAICGTSAIVAVAPLIEAGDEDMMLAIGAVNILGLLLMFALPLLGAALHLGNQAFGVWAGTTIHAVPQVVAAGFSYSNESGTLATLVKLVRVAMLAPFIFVLGIWCMRGRSGSTARIHYSRLAPGFVWGFLLLAVLNTFRLLPVLQFHFGNYDAGGLLTSAGEILLAVSMAAMGLEVNIKQMAKVGGRALLAGTLAAVVLCSVSLLLIRVLL
jgi:uncharacterized integral membrane protein (TIGR00698 family)